MKKPVQWHIQCNVNRTATRDAYQRQIEKLQADVARINTDIEVAEHQIVHAVLEGLTEFDCDRYLKPKKSRIPKQSTIGGKSLSEIANDIMN